MTVGRCPGMGERLTRTVSKPSKKEKTKKTLKKCVRNFLKLMLVPLNFVIFNKKN